MTNSPHSTKRDRHNNDVGAIDCNVERLAREVAPIIRAIKALEDADSKKGAPGEAYRKWREETHLSGDGDEDAILGDRLTAIQDLVMTMRAHSVVGALFQAMLCRDLLDDPINGAIEHGELARAKGYIEDVARAMQSIIGVLETCGGLKTTELDDGYFGERAGYTLDVSEKYLQAARRGSRI